jgi:hypothetical protein
MIKMTRIPTPPWARAYAQHVVEIHGDRGEAAKAAIRPLLSQIYAELDRRVNEFANDSGQCFLNKSDGFPVHDRLDGHYYVAGESYEGNSVDGYFRLWV